MTTTMRILPAIYWTFFLLLSVPNANATDTDQLWYQVEVFIFASNDLSASNGEQWPTDINLKYPNHYVVLNHNPVIEPPISNNNLINTDQPIDSHSTVEDIQAFRALPSDQRVLTEQAQKITHQHNYRALFHQAWRQQINDRNNAKSIIINGGQQFDKHFELEGSIKLSVERYLHIDTDLWLNEFVSNAGKEQRPWSPLPPVPELIEDEIAEQSDGSITSMNTFSFNQPAVFFSEKNPLERNHYVVEQTIVLQQHRRMRSNELHYIDHPLMGVLIKVIPYTPVTEAEPTLVEPIDGQTTN